MSTICARNGQDPVPTREGGLETLPDMAKWAEEAEWGRAPSLPPQHSCLTVPQTRSLLQPSGRTSSVGETLSAEPRSSRCVLVYHTCKQCTETAKGP